MKAKTAKKTSKPTERSDSEEFARYGKIDTKAVIEALDRLTEAVWAVVEATADRP